jgi:hypothetical protein
LRLTRASAFVICHAGNTPHSSVAAIVAAKTKASTIGSSAKPIWKSGSDFATSCTSAPCSTPATAIAAAPPIAESTRLSVISWRTSRPRLRGGHAGLQSSEHVQPHRLVGRRIVQSIDARLHARLQTQRHPQVGLLPAVSPTKPRGATPMIVSTALRIVSDRPSTSGRPPKRRCQ